MDRFVAPALGSGKHLSTTELDQLNPDELALDPARPNGLVLGHYTGKDIPSYHKAAHHYALFDRFYQAMSGGSTGNALYLVACRSCVNPGVSSQHMSPYDPRENGFKHGFFDRHYDHQKIMINDLSPIQGPTGSNNFNQLAISPLPESQTYPNIGDRLNTAKIDWRGITRTGISSNRGQ